MNKYKPISKEKAEQIRDELSEPYPASARGIARKVGVAASTVDKYKADEFPVLAERRAKKWQDLDLVGLAGRASQRADDALSKASAKDAAIVMGIAIEKGHLIEGKATANVNIVHEHRHSVPGLLDEIRKELERRQSHPSIEGQVEGEDEE